MAKRNDRRRIRKNKNRLYREMFRERGVKHIMQFMTPNLKHPTVEQIRTLDRRGHIWVRGDRFYKLAHKYYGKPEYWWVIAWFNQTPTEAHVEIGDVIKIPLPLHKVFDMLRTG